MRVLSCILPGKQPAIFIFISCNHMQIHVVQACACTCELHAYEGESATHGLLNIALAAAAGPKPNSWALPQTFMKASLRQKAARLQSSTQPAAASTVDRLCSNWLLALPAYTTRRIPG